MSECRIPAFPGTEANGLNFGDPGMSLRDYFAAKAMQGRMASSYPWSDLGFKPVCGLTPIQNEAALAYAMADAMLHAREATIKQGGAE